MNRYFKIIGKKQVALFVLEEDTAGTTASVVDFEKMMKCGLHEIGISEYRQLRREYDGGISDEA